MTTSTFTNRPRVTPDAIKSLRPDEIFVFGSNISGQHGGGAARFAYNHFGAQWGVGVGPQGQSYAIPTMQGGVVTIEPYVNQFIDYAKAHTDRFFYVTRIGCGIAGFADDDIAPLFKAAKDLPNVALPQTFRDILDADEKEQSSDGRTQVYNVVILDRSGSMSSIRQAAIDGFNETLATIKKAQEKYAATQKHNVTLVTFCSCGLQKVYSTTPVVETRQLTFADYEPCCGTPLYDAMGATLTAMRKRVAKERDAVVVVTIITDGEENASREYSGAQIKHLVDELRAEGWTFTYMGANQDAVEVAVSLSIRNARNFTADDEGTRCAMRRESQSRSNFYARLNNEGACGYGAMPDEALRARRAQLADEAFDEAESEA